MQDPLINETDEVADAAWTVSVKRLLTARGHIQTVSHCLFDDLRREHGFARITFVMGRLIAAENDAQIIV